MSCLYNPEVHHRVHNSPPNVVGPVTSSDANRVPACCSVVTGLVARISYFDRVAQLYSDYATS